MCCHFLLDIWSNTEEVINNYIKNNNSLQTMVGVLSEMVVIHKRQNLTLTNVNTQQPPAF